MGNIDNRTRSTEATIRASIELREEKANGTHAIKAGNHELIQSSLVKLLEVGELERDHLRSEIVQSNREALLNLIRFILEVGERLVLVERLVCDLHALARTATPVKEWYTVGEVAEILGKSEFTVREWCRLGRVHASKRECGRGKHHEWALSKEELLRVQNKGLLAE
jgi:hypothetical protein